MRCGDARAAAPTAESATAAAPASAAEAGRAAARLSEGQVSEAGSTGSPVVVLLFFGGVAVFMVYLTIHARRYRRKVRERDVRVRTASAEAAEDDAYSGADRLVPEARHLFLEAQSAWDARDRERLAKVVGDDLMVEWSRRLDDFAAKGWPNRVQVLEEPELQYVGLVNRGGR